MAGSCVSRLDPARYGPGVARARSTVGLPVLSRPEVPLYTGHLDGRLAEDLRTVARHRLAEKIFPISWPSKLPCPAWGLSASTCKTGSLLATVEGSVCHPSTCYARRGRFMFENVQRKFRQAYEGLFNRLWVPAGIFMITWECDDYWRWFHSGDIQDRHHLENIITIAAHTRHVIQWLPTREREVVLSCKERILKEVDNLRIRASGTMVGGPRPTWWPMTSTVIDSKEPGDNVCPSWEQDGKCESCRACTDPTVPNVIYRRT